MKKLIELSLWHEGCWMLELSRKHPNIELIVDDICSDGTDILATIVVYADEHDIESIIPVDDASPSVRALDVLDRGQNSVRLHVRYGVEGSIYGTIVTSSLTPIGEIYIREDREYWTLICDADEVNTAIDRLQEFATVDIRRISPYRPDESEPSTLVEELDEMLSDRQRTYLLSALDEGYYAWPRNISAKELAGKHDVSGPTALEHLRKGEATVLRHVLSKLRDRKARTRFNR